MVQCACHSSSFQDITLQALMGTNDLFYLSLLVVQWSTCTLDSAQGVGHDCFRVGSANVHCLSLALP